MHQSGCVGVTRRAAQDWKLGSYIHVLSADFNPDAEDNDDAGADVRDHRRGMCTFAFVPWDEVRFLVLFTSVRGICAAAGKLSAVVVIC